MSLNSTMYMRITANGSNKGEYLLLIGYERQIVQSTALRICTLTCLTRASLDKMVARMRELYTPTTIVDVTAVGIQKQLAKLFGEETFVLIPE